MSWQCVWHDTRPDDLHVGDMWPANWPATQLSDRYNTVDAAHRPPIMVALPSPLGVTRWCIDAPPSTDPAGCWHVFITGALVDGEPVRVNVTPSVNMFGAWHGFITDGWVTDDCDGRTYPGLVGP